MLWPGRHRSGGWKTSPAPSPLWTLNYSTNAATCRPGCTSALTPQTLSLHRMAPGRGIAGEQICLSTVDFTRCVRASASGWATRPRPWTSLATRSQCCQTWTSTTSTRGSTSSRPRVTRAAPAVWGSMRGTGTPTAPTHTLLCVRWLPSKTWWHGGSYASTLPACACWAASPGGSKAHTITRTKIHRGWERNTVNTLTLPAQSNLLI